MVTGVETVSVFAVAQSCGGFCPRSAPGRGSALDPCPGLSLGLDPCLCRNLALCRAPFPSLDPFHALGCQRRCVSSKPSPDHGCDLAGNFYLLNQTLLKKLPANESKNISGQLLPLVSFSTWLFFGILYTSWTDKFNFDISGKKHFKHLHTVEWPDFERRWV